MKYCVSCDWFQAFCNLTNETTFANTKNYVFKDAEHGTQIFKHVIKVYKLVNDVQFDYCVIACVPCNPKFLHPATAIIKLANVQLYSAGWAREFMKFLDETKIAYKGITRLDIAYDCNAYECGAVGSTLISNFLNRVWVKTGSTTYSINGKMHYSTARKIDSYKITPSIEIINAQVRAYVRDCNANQRTYTIQDLEDVKHRAYKELSKDNILSNSYNAIRFGSNSSEVEVEVYNKTAELRECTDKPYIRAAWTAAGISDTVDVWRTEIRITGHGKDILNASTGELYALEVSDLCEQQGLEDIFSMYASKYFKWFRFDGQQRKDRMHEIKLFAITNSQPHLKPKRNLQQAKPLRTLRMMANKLDKYAEGIQAKTEYSADRYATEILKRAAKICTEFHDKRLGAEMQAYINYSSECTETLYNDRTARLYALQQDRENEQDYKNTQLFQERTVKSRHGSPSEPVPNLSYIIADFHSAEQIAIEYDNIKLKIDKI
jgi:hypothetical protein